MRATKMGSTGVGEMQTAPTVGQAIVHAPASPLRSQGLAQVLIGGGPSDIDAGLHPGDLGRCGVSSSAPRQHILESVVQV